MDNNEQLQQITLLLEALLSRMELINTQIDILTDIIAPEDDIEEKVTYL
jgi:hypothetical protein